MIKVCAVVHRRPDLGVEEFQAYWRTTHGALVSKVPGIRRYVQSHPRLGGYRGGPLPFDGLAEIWADDTDALRAMAVSPELRAVRRDEPNFIDTSRLVELVVDETVVKDGPTAPLKSIELVRLAPGLPTEEARRYWREVHGPIAATIPAVRRYVQSHVRPAAYRQAEPPLCDGFAMTWFESVDDMRESARSDEYARTRADESNFLAPGDPATVIATEHVFV
jgi:uncharacterized protein (TIGR02118 family)